MFANEPEWLSPVTILFFWVYNWSPYWVTTLFREISFSLTMIFAHWCWSWNASLMYIQLLLLPRPCTSLGKVLLHLLQQCKTLVFAFQFLQFWLGVLSNWAGLQCIDGCLDKICLGSFCKTLLIGFSINSRKAVICEVLMFPADCSKRTGISLISTFNKFSRLSLCVLKSG